MPGFPNAPASTGFSFWDDEDDKPESPGTTEDQPGGIYGDDLADAESNADEDSLFVPNYPNAPAPAPVPGPVSHLDPVDGPLSLAPATMATGTSAPGLDLNLSTLSAGLGAESVPQISEQDGEEDDSGASEAEGRLRGDGSTFVKQRKISANLDVTDQMIVNLKNANHPNEYIANELKKHGLVPYDAKTVGSRFIRLQLKIAEREAQRLEDELTDWHEGEDEALIRADELAQNEIKDISQRAHARRWQIVSRNLHKILKKDLKYGPKACEKRFVELMDDRASIPIELDDQPEQRRADRARRVLERMGKRNLAEAREKTRLEQKRLENEQTALRVAMEKSKRAQAVADRAAQKARNAEAKAQLQTQKHKSLEMRRAAEEAQILETSRKYAEEHGLTYLIPPQSALSPTPAPSTSVLTPVPVTSKRKRQPKPVDPEVADSPRNHMSVKELGEVLSLRGLNKSGTKANLIKRLAAHDQTLSPALLKSRLTVHGANTEGNRAQLIDRLVQCEVAGSAWGQKHIVGMGTQRNVNPEAEPAAKRSHAAPTGGEGVGEESEEDEQMFSFGN